MINIKKIYDTLEEEFTKFQTPIVDLVEAQTKDPFKILVATILSARTNDKTTAQVVTKLFKIVHEADDFDKFTEEEVEKMIYPVGFFRNKAVHLKKLPSALNELYDGIIPDEIDDLVKLPGVGRKTANLVRAVAFKKPAICVDVHVHRICNRFGYIKTKTPFDTEMALRKKLPKDMWININSYLVSFGQNHCSPRNPKCNSCVIYDECNRVGVVTKYAREM
jgi:endonuclease III